MTALDRFHKAANDALEQIAARLPAEAEICLAIYTPGKPESDIVLKGPSTSLDQVVSTLRRRVLSIDGDNAYKRDLLDAVVGALALGAQDSNPPPAGHWGQRFWDIGREERAAVEGLLADLREAAATLRRYETLHRAKGTDDSTAKAEVNAALASRFEATIAKATE